MPANTKSNKKLVQILIIGGIFFLIWQFFTKRPEISPQNFQGEKSVSLAVDGEFFELKTGAVNVQDFLIEQKIELKADDYLVPGPSNKIFSGTKIILERNKKLVVKDKGVTYALNVLGSESIEKAIWADKKIELDEDDITTPARNLPASDGMNVTVTHVVIKDEIKNQDIAFKTISNEDDSLSWRVKKITTPGQKGVREIQYKVVYNNDKEISRKVLASNVTKDPVDEIVTQGTLVKVGKTYSGVGSWYAFKEGLFAANPWLPMGSYARVTNKDNGKSVIVKINDRGPFGNGRIIDLDKVAFSQIADLSAGVANMKVEAITN